MIDQERVTLIDPVNRELLYSFSDLMCHRVIRFWPHAGLPVIKIKACLLVRLRVGKVRFSLIK